MLVLVVVVCVFVFVFVFVFGSSVGSLCCCLVCSFVMASISISIVRGLRVYGPTLLLLLLFDSFRSNTGKFLLLFCLL